MTIAQCKSSATQAGRISPRKNILECRRTFAPGYKLIGTGLRIFLLDDEKDICYFFKEFLNRRGFEVYTALTGQAATNLIKKVDPDIAVLDIYLAKGKMDGIDVLRVIREKRPNCRCLMVTRADDEKLINQAKELGAVDYLVKPLTLVKVETALNKVIKKFKKGAK